MELQSVEVLTIERAKGQSRQHLRSVVRNPTSGKQRRDARSCGRSRGSVTRQHLIPSPAPPALAGGSDRTWRPPRDRRWHIAGRQRERIARNFVGYRKISQPVIDTIDAKVSRLRMTEKSERAFVLRRRTLTYRPPGGRPPL